MPHYAQKVFIFNALISHLSTTTLLVILIRLMGHRLMGIPSPGAFKVTATKSKVKQWQLSKLNHHIMLINRFKLYESWVTGTKVIDQTRSF